MTINKITSAQIGNLTSATYSTKAQSFNESIYKDFWTVTERNTDGASGKNAFYTPDWPRWHGYYRQLALFAAAIDKLAYFAVGDGYEASASVKKILDKLKGWGKDAGFNQILENQLRTCFICGDSFAEIIRDKKGKLVNLKPLNPGSIKIMLTDQNMLDGYEEISSTEKPNETFKVDEVFHLCWNRIANEVHGVPMAERMEDSMKAIKEVKNDQRVMFHRYIVPVTMIPVKTSDPEEIAGFSAKYTQAYTRVEPMMVPDETVNVKDIKHISIPQFSVHDPMPYLRFMVETFAEDIDVAKFTGEKITEASAKIIYGAFEMVIQRVQRYAEANTKLQLDLEIELTFSRSIFPELAADQAKDGPINKQLNMDPRKKE